MYFFIRTQIMRMLKEWREKKVKVKKKSESKKKRKKVKAEAYLLIVSIPHHARKVGLVAMATIGSQRGVYVQAGSSERVCLNHNSISDFKL